MNPKYELCICIPTFNRADKVVKLVRNILKCKNEKLTVAVLNNASTDATLDMLKEIDDSRFNIYSNSSNLGGIHNSVSVLAKAANARFALFCLDKDKVNIEYLDEFIDKLAKSDVGGGYVNHGSRSQECTAQHGWAEYPAGYEAIRRGAYLARHPSGYFFNVHCLSRIDSIIKYADKNYVGVFPFEFILADIFLSNRSAIFLANLIETESLADARSTKSYTTDGNSKTAYFYPIPRAKQYASFSVHALQFPLSWRSKFQLIAMNFKRGLVASTLGYCAIMKNEDICIHHYISTRRVSLVESIYNGLIFTFFYMYLVINAKRS